MPSLTPEIIHAAIAGFEIQKQRMDEQIIELRAMLPGSPAKRSTTPVATASGRKTKRKLSPAALQRMREGQQRRWAKVRGESAKPAAKAAKTSKRELSAVGKANIVSALKKRWTAKK